MWFVGNQVQLEGQDIKQNDKRQMYAYAGQGWQVSTAYPAATW